MDGAIGFVLVLVRVASVLAFLPFLKGGFVPRAVKALFGVVVAVALFPSVGAVPSASAWRPLEFVMFGAAEVLLGATMGLSALFIFKAVRNAGEVAGQQMGMALAHVADPLGGMGSSLIGSFCDTVAVLVFFAVGGHRLMILALADSLRSWPLGKFLSAEFFKEITLTAAAQNMELAVRLAAPLLLVAFTVSLLMALMARLVPEVNVLILGFPLRIGAGLVALATFTPLLVTYSGDVSRLMGQFLVQAAGGPSS